MFDFNGDGKTDTGERFIAYQIFEEIANKPTARKGRFDIWEKIIIVLVIWTVISTFFGR